MVKKIDTTKADAMPGVVLVLTGENIPKEFEHVREVAFPVDEKARYVGEIVAAVVAKSEEIAEEALDLVQVEYEPLPAVFDIDEALKPGAPVVNSQYPGNFQPKEGIIERGDVEKAFEKADAVVESTFEFDPPQTIATLERTGFIASWDPDGTLLLWGLKDVFRGSQGLADQLKIPYTKVRGMRTYVGAHFGSGKEQIPLLLCTAIAAKLTGRPVKAILTKAEQLVVGIRREGSKTWVKMAGTKDGKITAIQLKHFLNTGAYGSPKTMVPQSMQWDNVNRSVFQNYFIPNCKVEGGVVWTNTPPSGPFRGFGAPPAYFAVESTVDELAYALDIEPLELRRKNHQKAGGPMVEWGYPINIPLASSGLAECLAKGAEYMNWKDKWHKPGVKTLPDGRMHGMGLAIFHHSSGRGHSSAVVEWNRDGTVVLRTGQTQVGTGSLTALSMIVAEELGIPLEDIRVVWGDTEGSPYDDGSFSSRTTLFTGNAAKNAAENAKRALLEHAAKVLDTREDLEIRNREIVSKTDPAKRIKIKEVTGNLNTPWIMGWGTYGSPNFPGKVPIEWDRQYIGTSWERLSRELGAQFVEVAVDTETGQVEILNYVTSHDCGQVINPLICRGQELGALLMGLGYTMLEGLIFDKDGIPLNPNLIEYKIATSLEGFTEEGKPKLESLIVQEPDPMGPFGAHGIGEGSCDSCGAVLSNAIRNAIGLRLTKCPILPDAILRALGKIK